MDVEISVHMVNMHFNCCFEAATFWGFRRCGWKDSRWAVVSVLLRSEYETEPVERHDSTGDGWSKTVSEGRSRYFW